MLVRRGAPRRLWWRSRLISFDENSVEPEAGVRFAGVEACLAPNRFSLPRELCVCSETNRDGQLNQAFCAPQLTESRASCTSYVHAKPAQGVARFLCIARGLPKKALPTSSSSLLPTRDVFTTENVRAPEWKSRAPMDDCLHPLPPVSRSSNFPSRAEASTAVIGGKDMSRSPQALVAYLDTYIVGQESAKKAVAVALRQRWRRRQVRWTWTLGSVSAPLRTSTFHILEGLGSTHCWRLALLLFAAYWSN